jgi:hypothetical protein
MFCLLNCKVLTWSVESSKETRSCDTMASVWGDRDEIDNGFDEL